MRVVLLVSWGLVASWEVAGAALASSCTVEWTPTLSTGHARAVCSDGVHEGRVMRMVRLDDVQVGDTVYTSRLWGGSLRGEGPLDRFIFSLFAGGFALVMGFLRS